MAAEIILFGQFYVQVKAGLIKKSASCGSYEQTVILDYGPFKKRMTAEAWRRAYEQAMREIAHLYVHQALTRFVRHRAGNRIIAITPHFPAHAASQLEHHLESAHAQQN